MKLRMKHAVIGLSAYAIAITLVAVMLLNTFSTYSTIVYQNAGPRSYVNAVIWRNGQVIYNYTTNNIVATIGSTYVRDILGMDTIANPNNTKWISLSNDASPSKTWTKLPNEITGNGLARAEDTTPSTVNATAYQIDYTWTASGAGGSVQCTGLQRWAEVASDNNLVFVAAISPASLISGDQLQVTEIGCLFPLNGRSTLLMVSDAEWLEYLVKNIKQNLV